MNTSTTSNLKTPIQNFDSGYVYKVEEIEENEEITRQSAKGLISTASRMFPKVTRYFIRNDKGEPQGYIERQFIQNSITENLGDGVSNQQNLKNDRTKYGESKLHQDNNPPDSHMTLKRGNKSYNYNINSNHLYSRDRCYLQKYAESISLDGSVCDRSFNNYTLDYTSSNSTPSDKTYAIKHTISTSDTYTIGQRKERKYTKGRVSSRTYTKKSPSIFCKDPNKRLRNLFTIIKPKGKPFEETTYFPESDDIQLLNKTKGLLVDLIDKELQRIQIENDAKVSGCPKDPTAINNAIVKSLKLECMRKIQDELRLLKRLSNY